MKTTTVSANGIIANNNKVINGVKEITNLTIKEMVMKSDLFDLESTGMLKSLSSSLVNTVINSKIDGLIKKERTANSKGILNFKLNSILSMIDLSVISESTHTPSLPSMGKDVYMPVTERLIKEVSLYKDVVIPDISKVTLRVNDIIAGMDAIDTDNMFNMVYLSNRYLYDIIEEKGYYSDSIVKLSNDELNLIPSVAKISDVKDMLFNTLETDVKTVIEDTLEATINHDVMLDEIATIFNNANSMGYLLNSLYS